MYDLRRESPRIDVDALCWELIDGHEAIGVAVDLSSMGLRIERPYSGGRTRQQVPLQIEVPGIDEVMWATGHASSDVVVPGGPVGLLRRTGYRIVIAATRDLRLLKEFVFETDRVRRRDLIDVMSASCYARA